MNLLGLRVCAHDANVTYWDGEKIRYASFERLLQLKHHGFDSLYEWTSILDEWGVEPWEVEAICITMDTWVRPEVEANLSKIEEEIEIVGFRDLGFKCPIIRIDHHYAHTLSFWPLGIEPTIHFVFDGFGDDWMYRSVWRKDYLLDYGRHESVKNGYNMTPSPSLGFIMSFMGDLMELKGHELDTAGKVMAVKAFGNLGCPGVKLIDGIDNLHEVWNFDAVRNSYPHDLQWMADFIATAHEHTEQVYLKHFQEFIKPDDIVGYSGGIAQNTIINKVLRDNIPNLVIPPHANDQGLSLGCVEYLRRHFSEAPFPRDGFPYWQTDQAPSQRPSQEVIRDTAERLARGEVVGWYQGHGEVGPRALGNRSILMRPDLEDGKDIINKKVKKREPFRPFGASILEEKVSQYFYWNGPSPYMLYVTDVLEPERFPSITHEDGTCRHQTVSPEQNEDYYRLISEFEKLTGIPMLLNTSLNVNKKPIVGRVNDVVGIFRTSEMDAIVTGNKVIAKS